MASGRLADYIGVGPIASRPAAPNLYTGTLGLWFATDAGAGVLSAWDGASWEDIAKVDAIVGMQATGGWQDGDLLIYSAADGAFVAVPPGVPGDVLTQESGGASWQSPGSPTIEEQVGASYTFIESDSGRLKELDHTSAITAVLDAQMPAGFAVEVVQSGAGPIDFMPETGAQLLNRQGHNTSAGQWARCSLYVRENPDGNSARWILSGDTAV